jgi:D-glycero-D-manno-heptose 1,7-bisphosphate phosphatase
MNKAFFLDRDGTVNVDYNFVHTPEEWTWCDGAIQSIRRLNESGFKVIVVTNQSGISRGRYTVEQVKRLHRWVDRELKQADARIDDWYMAPHHPKHDPEPSRFPKEDRKPGTGMFKKAAQKHGIEFDKSFMAGDKVTDLQPALTLGITPFFIRSRHEPDQDKDWLEQHEIPSYQTLQQAINDHFEL